MLLICLLVLGEFLDYTKLGVSFKSAQIGLLLDIEHFRDVVQRAETIVTNTSRIFLKVCLLHYGMVLQLINTLVHQQVNTDHLINMRHP